MEGFVLVSALGRGYVLCCFACCSRSRWKLAAAMHSRLAFIHLDGSLRPAMRQKGSEQALSLGNAQIGLPNESASARGSFLVVLRVVVKPDRDWQRPRTFRMASIDLDEPH